MKYTGIIKGSRTLDVAALLAALGAIQQGMPQLQDMLAGYYGVVMLVIAAIMAYLRAITDGPIGEKSGK